MRQAGAATPQGGFNSLIDAAIAVDPGNGHLLVLDNLQPGFEHPEAAIEEFDASGNFLGQVSHTVIDGEPSGLAVSGATLYATSGNDEEANVFTFGPYEASGPVASGSIAAEGDSFQAAGAGASQSPAPAKVELRLALAGSSGGGAAATIRAAVGSPGTLSAHGRGLRAFTSRHVGAGSATLRLRLSDAGRRSLARSKLRKLRVKVLVTFAPDGGDAVRASKTVTFKAKNRGRR